jgi:hypothetical protein
LGRLTVAAAACLAVVSLIVGPQWVFASPASNAAACARGYTYGGYASRDGVQGVTASIAATHRPTVASGHAAAWVGVGGVHAALNGANAWLQTGLAAFAGQGLHLYVEQVSPGQARRFVDLGRATSGRSYRFAVNEISPDVWRASVDGRLVGAPAYLPTGGGSWRGVATAESWATGHAGCNSFTYRFDDISVRADAVWKPLGRGERVGHGVSRDRAGFSARA